MGHLYSLADDNRTRYYLGKKIPQMTYKLMADGKKLSRITGGLLDDLGCKVAISRPTSTSEQAYIVVRAEFLPQACQPAIDLFFVFMATSLPVMVTARI